MMHAVDEVPEQPFAGGIGYEFLNQAIENEYGFLTKKRRY
jgi:hypothetical protein